MITASRQDDSDGAAHPTRPAGRTDRELLRAYAETGSEEALREILARHGPMVYGICRRVLGDPGESEDAAQVTMLVFSRKASRLPRETVLAGWLAKAARLAALDARRRSIARQRRDEEAVRRKARQAPPAAPRLTEMDVLLDEALGSLPAIYHDAVVLRYVSGLSEAETAAALGCETATATMRVIRGLRKLRAFLGRRGFAIAPAALAALLGEVQAAPPHGFAEAALAACAGEAAAPATMAAAARRIESALSWARVTPAARIGAAAMLVAGLAGVALYRAAGTGRPAAPENNLAAWAAAPAIDAPRTAPGDVYVIKLERPFAGKAPSWLPLRAAVAFRDGQGVSGGAFSHQFNTAWHPVDARGLRLTDGRMSGHFILSLRLDARQRHENDKARQAVEDAEGGRTRPASGILPDERLQTIRLECPIAPDLVSGAATGTAAWDADAADPRLPSSAAPARAAPAPGPDPGEPKWIELLVESWARDPSYETLDALTSNAAILLRGRIAGGAVDGVRALGAVNRSQMEFADRLWTVREAALRVEGTRVGGRVVLEPVADAGLRAKYVAGSFGRVHPLPDGPLALAISARILGDSVFGAAACDDGATRHESAVLGRVRPYPYAVFADRAPRRAEPDRRPDPALAALAKQEASIPIRPGEPGKREFWTEYAMAGGCSFRDLDGARRVQYGNQLLPLDEFRARALAVFWKDVTPQTLYSRPSSRFGRDQASAWLWGFIAPPNFNLAGIPGAVRYRFAVYRPSQKQPDARFEADAPWVPLTPIWDALAPGTYQLVVSGLDAAGREVGLPYEICLPKKRPFDGPYYTPPRTIPEAALAHARWLRDHPRNAFARGLHQEGATKHVTTLSALVGPLVVHALAGDPRERAEALEMAVAAGELWLKSFSQGFLPMTYRDFTFEHWLHGEAWLDLYRATGDPRFAEAARLLAARLSQCQLPSGAWTGAGPQAETFDLMKHNFDPASGLYCLYNNSSIGRFGPFGQSKPQEWDPSSLLYFLGRVRKELKTDEFRASEEKAWQFLERNSIARFDWRKQGPGESRRCQHPWPTVPDAALFCAEYLALDLPGRPADWGLMGDIARWCEDRAVEWGRGKDAINKGYLPALAPSAAGEDAPGARLALLYARLATRTGDALQRAKAEALVGTALAAQNPVSGQIHAGYRIDPDDQGNGDADGGARGEHILMALWKLARLWAPDTRTTGR